MSLLGKNRYKIGKRVQLQKHEPLLIVFLFLVAVLFRFLLVRDNSIHFYFDQARDASISRRILEQRDLKIQGPSASATDDSVYHGVLYYYLIGPVYTLSGGNPAAAVAFLIVLTSSAVLPIYLIAKGLSGSQRVALFSGLLYALSVDASQMDSQLINSSLVTVTIAWLYFFIWRVFFADQTKYLPALFLFLGLTQQSAIFTLYLFGCIAVFYFIRAQEKNRVILFEAKTIVRAFALYFLATVTMILTQLRLFQAGLFAPLKVFSGIQSGVNSAVTLENIFKLFSRTISNALFPSLVTISLITFLIAFIWFLSQRKYKHSRLFLTVWFLGPVFLFSFAFRDHYHTLVGILPPLFIILSLALSVLSETRIGKIFVTSFFAVFLLSNFSVLQNYRRHQYDDLSVQKGAYLQRQLALIDKTYQVASGKPFSISALTAPHGYSTTWAYLYDWYGLTTYGYIPYWFGGSQLGIPAGELLSRVEKPLGLHFTIYEPDPGTIEFHRLQFIQLQNDYMGSPSADYRFGTLQLELRQR